MVKTLNASYKGFKTTLQALLEDKSESSPEVNKVAKGIVEDVMERGDSALLEYTLKFDKADLTAQTLRVTQNELDEAEEQCDLRTIEALKYAAERIEAYHYHQSPDNVLYQDHKQEGISLGWKWSPVHAVGLYVPGGKAAYPSSVLMNAIPARIAGVERMVMTVPAPEGQLNPLVLVAANIAGIEEIYKIGGAQAIAALAYGTNTIVPVDKIVGPGNAYVAAAKRHVFGKVGIDMIAGPSEILIISDNNTNPDWVAADLLSQAEHDEDARSMLITDDEKFAEKVKASLEKMLPTLSRQAIARKSWDNNGIIIIVDDMNQAAEVANIVAPEHLELMVNDPQKLEKRITNAGAIFLGRFTPEAVGDYTAGPSHVLPTAGSARFSSGLGVFDFLKRTSLIHCEKKGMLALMDATERLAEEEGLDAHALSMIIRRQQ